MAQMRGLTRTFLAMGVALAAAGCGMSYAPLPAGSTNGRIALYDYSPSVIQSGNVRKVLWCGGDFNPYDTKQYSDTIQYESTDLSTQANYGPVPVLGETPGAWDSVYTCNPKVVQGSFVNPLGDGESFTYAMYYVAVASLIRRGKYFIRPPVLQRSCRSPQAGSQSNATRGMERSPLERMGGTILRVPRVV